MTSIDIFVFVFFLPLTIGLVALLFLTYFTRVKYEARDVMTPGELRFFKVLSYLLDKDYLLLSQVRLANVVTLKNQNFLWRHFMPIAAKCLDFVIVERQTGKTILVVELDDKSHKLLDRKRRDVFIDSVLQRAGVMILHLSYQANYENEKLKEEIAGRININIFKLGV